MNILFISTRFPSPPLKGDQLIVYNRIKGLSKYFKITLLVFYTSKSELEDIEEINQYCEEVITVRLSKWRALINLLSALFKNNLPLQVNYYSSDFFLKSLKKVLARKDFGVVHCFTIRLAEYVRNLKTPVIYELIDSMQLNIENMVRQEKWIKKYAYKIELERISEYESMVCSTNKFLTVVSEKDKKRIGSTHIKVIPNGVDTERFIPGKNFNHGEIIFSGNMSYLPNIHAVRWFVEECFPIIRQAIPHAVFRIVGVNPSMYIRSLHNSKSIFVTGYVDQIFEELQKAHIAVAPMKSGSGMQNKIVEAMACGIPVVTTHNGLEGLFAEPGEEILVADTPSTFAQAVIDLIKDKKLWQKISSNTRSYVEKNHSWDASNEKILDIYLDAFEKKISVF